MIWKFFGEHWELQVDAEGRRSLLLVAAWHKPLPSMGGPRPELELEDVEALFAQKMQLRIFPGEPRKIVEMAREYVQTVSGDAWPQPEYDPRCMIISSHETGIIEIHVALDPARFVALQNDLTTYATAAGPKCFGGTLHAIALLAGPAKLFPTVEEIASFMSGKKPAMTIETPWFFFSFGLKLPDAPRFRDLLGDLMQLI